MMKHWLLSCCLFAIISVCVTLCPEGFVDILGDCFLFDGNEPRTWSKARERCQELGGDLAVLKDCEVFRDLVRYIHMSGESEVPDQGSYWIGGSDQGAEGQWYWVDLTPMNVGVPFWGSDKGVAEPSVDSEENCAHLYKYDRYYIHDGNCENFAFPLCQASNVI